ncbi:hypothetical protein L6164_028997 [Bauhinia variegata]|uniref:Uncharacterized protein n=1 Tax=Bauhinia variegata TaxID=167791 RepID=A0ACB9L894_BAUVA|nr:hypothetical protein L6164_028997 [Bauhinia variegata]
MSTSSEKKVIKLISSEGETLEVEIAVAIQSETIKNLMEDVFSEGNIPLPNLSGPILSEVIEYMKKHKEEDEVTLRAWDAEFVKVDQGTLFDLVMAAHCLNIKGIFDLTCQAMANIINQGMSVEEIRKLFNVENDFTPEEEEEIRRENQWAFNK